MMMKNKLILCSALIIVLTACIMSTGCTSSQSTPTSAQSIPPTVSTPAQTLSPITTLGTQVTSLTPTTTPTAIVSTTVTPANEVLTVTLNSAEKMTSLSNGIGKPGRIMLLLDITIKNNDKKNDFTYTDASFVISDKSNEERLTAITSQKAKGLANPLIMGTVPSGSTNDGKILFGVNATSNNYKLSVVDSTGTVLASIDNINVP
jgi:hypothetical protein